MRLGLDDIAELERLYEFASPQEKEVILELLREQSLDVGGNIADVRFVDYVRATVDFELEPWQLQFCEILQDAADNPGTKICIHKPPQMGGTILASQRWGSWLLGRNPMHRHVGVSYSMQQAGEVFGYGIRNAILGDAHIELFPATAGHIDKRSSMEGFRTHARTAINDTQFSFLAVGVQSGVVGKGFDTVVVDDPYGTPENAVSPSINEKVHRFLTQALGPRITEKTTVVCMFHRYSLNDVAAKLIDSGEYRYHRFAMVADENADSTDPTGREPGEILSPRRTLEWCQKIAEQDIKLYMSQLQGVPLAASAQIINPDSFRDWPLDREKPRVRFWYRGYDLALVEHTPDETASVLMGMTDDGEILVEDIQHWRKGILETEERILQNAERDPPGTFVCLYNENTHISSISRLRLHEHIRVIEVRRKNQDKYACAAGWVAQADRGKVYFSRSCKEAPYFKVQCANFANEKLDRDDLIDAFSAAYESTHRHRAVSTKEETYVHPDSFAYFNALMGRGRRAIRTEDRANSRRGIGTRR